MFIVSSVRGAPSVRRAMCRKTFELLASERAHGPPEGGRPARAAPYYKHCPLARGDATAESSMLLSKGDLEAQHNDSRALSTPRHQKVRVIAINKFRAKAEYRVVEQVEHINRRLNPDVLAYQ